MRNLQESLTGLNEHYLEMLKHLNRMLEINLEAIHDGKVNPKLYGECFIVEDVINAFEVKVKEDCINCIARFQPAAKNLRELIMLIDGVRLIERMADILKANFRAIKNIETNSPEINSRLDGAFYEYLIKIKKIFDSYVTSFATSDETILYELISADEEINKKTDEIVSKIANCIKENPNETEILLEVVSLVKKYERFSDHIIHLVVDLVYTLKGENLRKKELLEEQEN
ncbi:PhoU domain-containing protein [Fusobacterium perfoetens]|uniref:PhoU domain-containing protein n=1 Tax=Fusobacterium perfoetens TaxID=852 RepID=UPI00047F796C|nr:PhoU domain-containing protein [Fusobacterium perfoetens]